MKLNCLLAYSSIFLLLLFVFPSVGNAQTYVKVTSEEAGIYTQPVQESTSFDISARKGDTFEVINTQNRYTQIHLFSGEKRYIKSSQVKIVLETQPFPSDSAIIGDVCNKIEIARRKAKREASDKYPDRISKQASYEDMLFDKYALLLFREFEIQATHYSKLALCVDDSLF